MKLKRKLVNEKYAKRIDAMSGDARSIAEPA